MGKRDDDTSPRTGLRVSARVMIPATELEFVAIRAQGPGGQHVNKSSTAVQLRFDIRASSLPEWYKARLLTLRDRRVSGDGVIVIKAQQSRSQEANREAALVRLQELIQGVAERPKPRRPTAPSAGARRRRADDKTRRGKVKALRGRIDPD